MIEMQALMKGMESLPIGIGKYPDSLANMWLKYCFANEVASPPKRQTDQTGYATQGYTEERYIGTCERMFS